MGRVLGLDELVRLRSDLAAQGKRIVLTNGCFDLLHVGHARYLQEAKALGDILIVGLNDDASVRRLKGEPRPIVAEDDRAELLASLACVDYVVIFKDDTAIPLVEALKPDIYVKGADYGKGGKELPEAPTVEHHGGRVELVPLADGRSTTDIVRRIRGE